MDEFSFIANYLRPLAAEGAFALTDDAASFAVPQGYELILTKDALVRGVHFIGDEPAHLIAQKALRVSLSDCAAMGATPKAYLLALMIPPDTSEEWLREFAEGLKSDQETFNIALLGGDTTRTLGELAISVTMLALVPKGTALRRNGAKVGDNIYVSGTIGDAALGLSIANNIFTHGSRTTNHDYLLSRYQLPKPRVTLGQQLRNIASACMDISDGLVQDLGHICKASEVGAEIAWESIPLSHAARACNVSPQAILAGGDDYELLFTAPPASATAIIALGNVTHIGTVTQGNRVKVMNKNNADITPSHKGYKHF